MLRWPEIKLLYIITQEYIAECQLMRTNVITNSRTTRAKSLLHTQGRHIGAMSTAAILYNPIGLGHKVINELL